MEFDKISKSLRLHIGSDEITFVFDVANQELEISNLLQPADLLGVKFLSGKIIGRYLALELTVITQDKLLTRLQFRQARHLVRANELAIISFYDSFGFGIDFRGGGSLL